MFTLVEFNEKRNPRRADFSIYQHSWKLIIHLRGECQRRDISLKLILNLVINSENEIKM